MPDFTPQNLVSSYDVLELFFKRSICTQEQCNSRLYEFCNSQNLSNVALNWDPDRQGCASYTVFISAKDFSGDIVRLVAQFRIFGETLDPRTIASAVESYGKRFVPRVTVIHDNFPLQLSISEHRGGTFGSHSPHYDVHHLRTFVQDFARFLVAARNHPRPSNGEVEALVNRLGIWSKWRISPRVDTVVERLYHDAGIFAPFCISAHLQESILSQVPIVLTHVDLNTLNVLSDSEGYITGIVDWTEAENQPFGMSLFAVETFLGGLTSSEYGYRSGHLELREHFWESVLDHLGASQSRSDVRRLHQSISDMGLLQWQLARFQDASRVSPRAIGYLEALLRTNGGDM
jgi:Phosphotransferase enzyme family